MRRLLLLLTVAVVMAAMMVASAMPAFAHNVGPCGDETQTGSPEGPGHSEFARHHVVPTAGQDPDDHHPGVHQGFSECEPSENRP